MTLDIHNFEHGWADATLSVGHESHYMQISYISDGIGDMARAAVYLMKGSRHTTFRFSDEPGEYVFILDRTQYDLINFSLYRNKNAFTRRNETELVRLECPLLDFVGPVFHVLHSLLLLEDPPYKVRWKHDFPKEEYDFLNKIL